MTPPLVAVPFVPGPALAKYVETPNPIPGVSFPPSPERDVVPIGMPLPSFKPLGFNDAVFAANALSSNSHGNDTYAVLQSKDSYTLIPAGIGEGDLTRGLRLGIPELHQSFNQAAPNLSALVGAGQFVKFDEDRVGSFHSVKELALQGANT